MDHPAWSPKGEKLAFVSNRAGNDEIYVMNAKGSGVTRLTHNSAAELGQRRLDAPLDHPPSGLRSREEV
jgi:hypothetical protein